MNKDQFSEVETLKRRLKDLNRELFHTRNLAENLREENKQLGEKVKTLEFFKKGDSATVDHATGVIDEMRSQISSLKTQLAVYKEDMQKDAERIAELEQKSQCIRNLVKQKAKAESKLNRIALAAQKKLGTFGAALRFNDEVKDILKGGDT